MKGGFPRPAGQGHTRTHTLTPSALPRSSPTPISPTPHLHPPSPTRPPSRTCFLLRRFLVLLEGVFLLMFQRLWLGLGAALGSMLQVLVRLLVMVVVMVVVVVVVEIIMVVVVRLLLLLLLGVMVRMVVVVMVRSTVELRRVLECEEFQERKRHHGSGQEQVLTKSGKKVAKKKAVNPFSMKDWYDVKKSKNPKKQKFELGKLMELHGEGIGRKKIQRDTSLIISVASEENMYLKHG
eukprot:bmy_00131T0